MICFGLESGNQKILDRAHKRITLEKARRAVELSKEPEYPLSALLSLACRGKPGRPGRDVLLCPEPGDPLRIPSPGPIPRDQDPGTGLRIRDQNPHGRLVPLRRRPCGHGDRGGPADEVESFAQSFFQKLGSQIEEMQKGTLAGTYQGPYRQEMEKRIEVDFVWKLLAGDLIEGQGRIPRAEIREAGERAGPLNALAVRLAGIVSMPLPLVEGKLGKTVRTGPYPLSRGTDSFTWAWRE